MSRTKLIRIVVNASALAGSMALTVALGMATAGPARAAVAFDPGAQPVGHVAMPEVTSHLVAGGGQTMFAIDYNAQTWAGNLHAYPIAPNGQVTTSDFWGGGAASAIDAQDFDTERKIFTAGGKAFRWDALTSVQQAYFGDSTSGPKVVSFLRGDRADEAPAGSLRTRAHVLGDIIHSTPVYHDYGSTATVFVGANDGMLHAINGDTGAERFAYVPAGLMPRLGVLATAGYNAAHEYFVDGNLAVRAFSVSGTSKVILAGTLGAGGRGLYGLNISTPAPASETAAAAAALWEITSASAGYANLGYTYASPTLVVLAGGVPALAVGNGYENTGNGQASLFLVNALTGALIAEIGTGSGSLASPNGLSSARVMDTDADGQADTAYAGDLDGHLWKFNLVDRTAALLLTTSPAQAITMAPAVKDHPYGGRMVAVVTGRMLAAADATDASTHYAYGVWDGAPAGNTNMLNQTLAETTFGAGALRVRTATGAVPNWADGQDRGWKTALPIGGERVIGDGAVAQGGTFLFLSTNPTANTTASPAGENWWMQLNVLSGGDNNAVYFDLNNDGYYDANDEVTVGTEILAPVGKHVGGGVRSQFTVLATAASDVLHASYDINSEGPAPVASNPVDPGVSGGHFDFDIFYSECAPLATSTVDGQAFTYLKKCLHTHEYDDIYDVTGVDMLNSSKSGYNLRNTAVTGVSSTSATSSSTATYTHTVATGTTTTVISSTPSATVKQVVTVSLTDSYRKKGTRYYEYRTTTTIVTETHSTVGFKVLAANQAYSPAAKLTVGGNPYVKITAFGTGASLDVAALPQYTVDTIGSLAVNLPLDAFRTKDWAGTGDQRVGLHPTQPNCMYGAPPKFYAPENAWRNGSLVVQIIKSSTPQSAVELNVSGRPDLGWRIKPTVANMQYLIAEYVMFWHHPNGKCYGDAGWVNNPPQDAVSDATPRAPDAGSTDPKDGLFNVVSHGDGSGSGGATGGGSGSGAGDGSGAGAGDGSGAGAGDGAGATTGVGFGGDQQDATNSLAGPGTVSVVNGENKSKEKLGRASWRQLLN